MYIIGCLSCPLNDNIDIESVTQKPNNFFGPTNLRSLGEEIINIKCNINLKSMETIDCNFWNLINKNKYPNIWTIACFNAFFGST